MGTKAEGAHCGQPVHWVMWRWFFCFKDRGYKDLVLLLDVLFLIHYEVKS